MDIIKLNNEPIELTTEFLDNILALLKEAHDKMDELNNKHQAMRLFTYCNFCTAPDYDGTGIVHDDDCILVKIRKVIDV